MLRMLKSILAPILILPLIGHSGLDQAIQASATLLYSVEEPGIAFTPQEIEALWDQLGEARSHAPAEKAYTAWIQEDKDSQRLHLKDLWLELKSHELSSKPFYHDFDSNPHLTKSMRKEIKPYLLPAQHPLKPALNAIFGTQRATMNKHTMIKAGFTILFAKQRSFILVARHPLLPDHLVKLNVDSEKRLKKKIPAWKWLVRRCRGIQKVRRVLAQKHIEHFQAPQKWLYPLPVEPSPPEHFLRQPVILLVEDMKLVPWEQNLNFWKHRITHRQLDELYMVISHAGGSSYRPDNVWLSTNGKLSFIDTEYPDSSPNFDSMRSYLSPQNREYWDKLVRHGGPK